MSKNYIQVELGGKLRGLKFNMGTLRILGELTETDPLKLTTDASEVKTLYGYLKNIVYASLQSNCLNKKEVVDFSEQDVQSWVDELEYSDSLTILTAFGKAYNTEKEGNDNTQG
jgi:hypothetical protein